MYTTYGQIKRQQSSNKVASDKISINLYFSYKTNVKQPFLFIQINDDLVILEKLQQEYLVSVLTIATLLQNYSLKKKELGI